MYMGGMMIYGGSMFVFGVGGSFVLMGVVNFVGIGVRFDVSVVIGM